jgi:heavy metal sensor kinase
MRRTLREIVDVFLLALPFAVLGASFGGYFVARRSLRPVKEMARQAERITSESLSARLPNPNPADEFGELATVFNGTLQRLQSSFGELQRFTADASHELRTPLTALRAVGELAIKGSANPVDLRETILSMLEEAERLDELIESLLIMARLERGELTIRSEPVRALELCREIADTLAVLAQERQQTLQVRGDAGLAALADRLLLRQALMNVMHNAIRNSPDGTSVETRVERADGRVVFCVTDEGPGIAPEHLSKIFDRFFRVDEARSRGGGFGLGLAIAKRSIERQGGTIEVDSEIGRGSTFRIVLPIADLRG